MQHTTLEFQPRKILFTFTRTTMDYIAVSVAEHLESIIRRNQDCVVIPEPKDPTACFYSLSKLPFSLVDYIYQILSYSPGSPSAAYVAVAYMLRLQNKKPSFCICEENVHRLFLVSLMLATKYLDDEHLSNTSFAKIGGLRNRKELNELERVFLKEIEYELYVKPAVYSTLKQCLTLTL